MYCSNCGKKQEPSANFCSACGKHILTRKISTVDGARVAARASNTPEPSVDEEANKYSTVNECIKFFLLSIVTFGMYSAYWGWRRWAFVGKMKGENTSPSISGVFLGFTSFSLFGNIQTIAVDRTKNSPTYSPGLWGTLLLILFFIDKAVGKSNADLGILAISEIVIIFFETLVIASPSSALAHLLNHDIEARDKYEAIGHNVPLICFLAVLAALIIFLSAVASKS